ncbi:protease pro-enzyme activation domain-containing protein [Sulfolobus tengchongensis]|uniref:Protease pro-enzyme activation domain-containing protein n=1 Tax=Sulfolobus tengchongensis TaxID=207809 RepID=A0AAX4L1B4_9CREN
MIKYLFLLSILLLSIIPLFSISMTNIYEQPLVIKGFSKIGTLNTNQEVIVTIFIPLKNLGLLYYYANAVSNPNSPLYHKFLSEDQVRELFLPIAQYNEILDYVKNNGFQILFTALDSVIVVKGTVEQVETYFGTNFAVYSNGTVTYYTNYGYPKINAYVYSSNISALFLAHPSTLITENTIRNLEQEVNMTSPIEAYWPTALRNVYNVTAIPTQGENTTIGILDFYGDPYIIQQLAYFDKITGLPNPPNFTIIPIGPYNPNLGILTGWAGEISLDVEVAHAMAPKANMILYIANPDIPLSAVIAYIVNQDNVNVLSQSFSIPESLFSSIFNGASFYSCIVLSDEYYALGSAEGITFLASSGDTGGSGYSNGPLGTVGYPSSSPFVTAVGGTTTYIQFPNGSYYQTAWSNYGFVPNNVNYGGSTGGVSIVEPKPWYQWGLKTPSTYPNGKLIPEISANANVYPGIYVIFPNNQTGITGGTSEASPLIAGLLATIESYTHERIGLLNPVLSYMAENYYGKAIQPITFGYNIPWTASYGYNLVTGYGTINVGYFAKLLPTNLTSKELSVVVSVYNTSIPSVPPQQLYPGQRILVTANITYPNGTTVQYGSFKGVVENYLGNITTFNMTYNPLSKLWVGYTILPKDASGILFIYVMGNTTKGIEGIGYYEIFSGYYITFSYTMPFTPVYTKLGNAELGISLSNSFFQAPVGITNITLDIFSYNITNNEYTLIDVLNLSIKNGVGIIDLPSNLSAGDLLIEATNAYGFDAFTNGIYMQSLFILPQVLAEPGSVAPGQYIIITGNIIPPVNLPVSTFQNVLYGSNITAELVSESGMIVSKTNIPLNESGVYYGYLYVPKNVTSGLYDVLLFANYYSNSLNTTIQGFYYGQIYVSNQLNVIIKSIKYAFEGQNVIVYANITNGSKEITFGMFSATVYPESLSFEYTSPQIQSVQIPLWYNPVIGLWEGNFTLPSVLSVGNLTYLAGNGYYGTPFKVLITGISAFGSPTSTSNSGAYSINVLPYTLIEDQTLSESLPYYANLVNVRIINSNGNLLDDIFNNVTVINSNVKIIDGNVSGVTIYNSTVFLIQSSAENITLYNSTLYTIGGSINGIKVINSKLIPTNTPIKNIYPMPPTIFISSPSRNLTGTVNITVNVIGEDIAEVNAYLDGNLIATFANNGTHVITIDTSKYPDGGYNLTVSAIQNDGLSASNSTYLYFENNLVNLNTNVNSKITTISNQLSNVSTSLTSLKTSLFDYQIISLSIGIIAIILAIMALVMRRR